MSKEGGSDIPALKLIDKAGSASSVKHVKQSGRIRNERMTEMNERQVYRYTTQGQEYFKDK